jgi:hypothetical protein
MKTTNNHEDGDAGVRRSNLLESMRQTAADPDANFPKRCRAVFELVNQGQATTSLSAVLASASAPGAKGNRPALSIEDHVASPGPWDRVIALTFFFQAAAFVRALTPKVLSQVSDPEVRFLALCLGLDPGATPPNE